MPLCGPVCVPMWMCAYMCMKGYKDLCLGRPEFKPNFVTSCLVSTWLTTAVPQSPLLWTGHGDVCIHLCQNKHTAQDAPSHALIPAHLHSAQLSKRSTGDTRQERTSDRLKQSPKPKQRAQRALSAGQHLLPGHTAQPSLNPILTDNETVGSPMLFLIKGQPGHRQQGQRWFFSTARGRKFFPCDLDFLSYAGGSRCFSGARPKIQSLI